MLNSLVNFFTTHIPYWPLVCFSLLILAGFNLPVSEDAVIVLSAGVTLSDNSLIIPTWIALYLGIFISDIMVYWWGYFLSKGMFQFKKIRKTLTENKIRLVAKTLDDYGFRTFIVCRFIPFGIRNTLWMSSGFVGLPFKRFLFYDSIATLVSCSTLYHLVRFIGEGASVVYKIIGIVLFIALIVLFVFMIRHVIKKETKFLEDENEQDLNFQ